MNHGIQGGLNEKVRFTVLVGLILAIASGIAL
jgi:hypothetical protein